MENLITVEDNPLRQILERVGQSLKLSTLSMDFTDRMEFLTRSQRFCGKKYQTQIILIILHDIVWKVSFSNLSRRKLFRREFVIEQLRNMQTTEEHFGLSQLFLSAFLVVQLYSKSIDFLC